MWGEGGLSSSKLDQEGGERAKLAATDKLEDGEERGGVAQPWGREARGHS